MSILYIQEHLHCKNYTFTNKSAFKHFHFKQGEVFSMESKEDFVFLFMLRGKMGIFCSCMDSAVLEEDQMYSFGHGWNISANVLEDSEFLVLVFDTPHIRCDQFSMISLKQYYKPEMDQCVRTLAIKPQVASFICNIIFYLDNQMYCKHLQDIKQSEWFFLMRAFYTKEENAMFFAPLIVDKNEFVLLVKEKAEKISTVNELAEACNMTTKTFTRNFKKYFNSTPKKWLQAQKKQEVKLELLRSTNNMKVLSNNLGFSSTSHLSSYCKRNFDQTIKDIKASNS